ncbi:MAG: penicillin-binding transpeptidase domain-containing protein [Gemmatimonadota bacterium]|nr:penicillin-binding transpeptidase domain-containing protein [Gemmatimonadota bacterium]
MTRFGIQNGTPWSGPRPPAGSSRPIRHALRQRVLVAGFTAVSCLYGIRLAHLQIVQGDELRERLFEQSAKLQEVPAPRGSILDRTGRTLAEHDALYAADVAVRELAMDRDAAIAAIREVIDLGSERERALRTATRGWTRLASGVTDEERVGLERRIGSGLHFTNRPARAYPGSAVARRLLGGMDSEGKARSGLELSLDSLLRGEPGRVWVRQDGLGRHHPLPDAEGTDPRPGYDVYLTIDAALQRIAEDELERAMTETGAAAGDILILDPRTGELLAVASERRGAAPGHVPAFSEPYEPGSTLKPFLLASLMSEGLVDLTETLDVENGVLRMGPRTIRDVHGYEDLTVREILTHSSNVGAAKLAGRLRPRVQHRYLRDFGFGMRTRIEHPSESGGRLMRPSEWTSLSPASHGIGYEISITSLQLAAAYGALANDGVLMQPRLVREVRDPSGRLVRGFTPTRVRRVVSPRVARAVTGVLEDVVEEGTGILARMASLSVAGKTGTARLAVDGGYARGRYRASFVGYAPSDEPRVVILTRLEDPARGSYYGGAIAAPTSQATLQAALATSGVHIDPRLVIPASAPRRWSGRRAHGDPGGPYIFAVDGAADPWPANDLEEGASVSLPNVEGLPLRSAVARLHEAGLRVVWRGKERVRTQSPPPGAKLAPGEAVVLR